MADNPRILNFYHLLNYRFNIPEYQRGYRWEKKQVVDLMNDLKDFIDRRAANQLKDKEFYCLQPVVVYKIGDNHYDVIDGQQRLTTLYLILQASFFHTLKLKSEKCINAILIHKIVAMPRVIIKVS